MAGPLDRTWFNALVDDDGSGTTGTIWEKSQVDGLLDSVDAALATVPTAPVPPSSVTPAGANKQIQFNDAGLLQGDAGLTYDKLTRQLAAGAIVFPTPAVPSANLTTLDDYREGTWAPTLGGSGGQSGQVYGTRAGMYQKVGRWVTATFHLEITTVGTLSGGLTVGGWPFPHDAGIPESIGPLGWHNLATNLVGLNGVLDGGASALRLLGVPSAINSCLVTALTQASLSPGAVLFGTLRYPTTS